MITCALVRIQPAVDQFAQTLRVNRGARGPRPFTPSVCVGPVAQVPLKRLSYVLRRHEDAPRLHDGRTVLRTHSDGTSVDVDGSQLQDLYH